MGMHYFAQAQNMELASMGLEGINAFLHDLRSSDDENAPTTCGFFRMEAGNSLEYTYKYDEFKIMLDGEMTIAVHGGETVTIRPGDVVFFEKGTTATFSSQSSGQVFYVAQRRTGEL